MAWIEPRATALRSGERATVRAGGPGDARGVLQLTGASLADSDYLIQTPDEFAPSLRRTRAWLRRLSRSETEIVLVAEIDRRIIGLLDTVTEPRRRLAHSTRFGLLVAAPWRDQGLGRALLSRLIDWARAHSTLERIELHVHADNVRARALYASLGFEEEGVRRRAIKYEDGRYMDDVLMALFVKEAAGASAGRSRPDRCRMAETA